MFKCTPYNFLKYVQNMLIVNPFLVLKIVFFEFKCVSNPMLKAQLHVDGFLDLKKVKIVDIWGRGKNY